MPGDLMTGDLCPHCGGILHYAPVDWGYVYTKIVSHTNIGYFDIPELPIPGFHAILANLPDEVNLKRAPFLGYGNKDDEDGDKPYTVDDAMSVLAMFGGL